MKSVEKQAKTVDKAIELALEELSASPDEVLIEVLDEGETGGLLGFGRRSASVRVSLINEQVSAKESKDEKAVVEDEFSNLTFTDYSEENEPKDYRERLAADFMRQAESAKRLDKTSSTSQGEKSYNNRKRRNYDSNDRDGQAESRTYQKNYDRGYKKSYEKPYEKRQRRSFNDNDEQADNNYVAKRNSNYNNKRKIVEKLSEEERKELEDKALDFLAKIFSGLEIHGTMASFYDANDCLHVDVDGDELGHAIGRGGESLEAIQYITTLALNKGRENYFRVIVDIGKYREKNNRFLRRRAEQAAYKALDTGRQQVLPPMSSADRRIVHMTVAKISGVYSSSQGEEPRRRVVINKAD